MKFTLTVKGSETLVFSDTIINFANASIDTPKISMARSTDVAITVHISGKLLVDGEVEAANNSLTSKLFEWSKTPAKSPEAYRDVTVTIATEKNLFRQIHLPNAFVVSYSEIYNELRGVGEFSLILRQKADKVDDVKLNT